jgi:hypothetical protein
MMALLIVFFGCNEECYSISRLEYSKADTIQHNYIFVLMMTGGVGVKPHDKDMSPTKINRQNRDPQ